MPSRGTQIARLELRLAHIHEPRFVLNSQSLVRDCDLIVLDEVSMVGEEMANDLLAFGKPILVLGDPGQLPPIHGEGAFTNVAPDVMLDEIHRQAGTAPSCGSPPWRARACRSTTAPMTSMSGRCPGAT